MAATTTADAAAAAAAASAPASFEAKYGTAAHGLSAEQVRRYSRQLLLPTGPEAQKRICAGRVLVVGAGGLGAPVLLYLAAAGVGTLGVVDADVVTVENLHRQVIHSEATLGVNKAESAARACAALNSSVRVRAFQELFTSANAMEIARDFDVLVDASDNVSTRYLVSDVGVLLRKPVVSGSALRFEGQLTVYGHRPVDGPCYRCIFPVPPPPDAVANCSDAGVMGAVTGVIGSLQALEVIKILSGKGQVMARQMLVFDGLENRFLNVRLRGRQRDCAACGDQPTLHAPVDYVQLCGVAQHDQQGIENHRKADVPNDFSVSVEQFAQLMREARGAPLLDVRDSVQFAICSLPGAVNIPLKELPSRLAEVEALLGDGDAPLYVVCRRGVSSTKATLLLRERGVNKGRVLNVQGGLMSWKARVDPEFPMY